MISCQQYVRQNQSHQLEVQVACQLAMQCTAYVSLPMMSCIGNA